MTIRDVSAGHDAICDNAATASGQVGSGGNRTPDFNIQITVRNARLLRAVRQKFGSASEMCRVAGINQQAASALMTMRAKPFRQDGSLTAPAAAIVSALGMEPEQLWPAHVARLQSRKATVEIEMGAATFSAIADGDPDQRMIYRQAISRWSRTLTDREKTAVVAHVAGATLDQIGAELGGVTRERARQIVLKGERKMRRLAIKDGVSAMGDLA